MNEGSEEPRIVLLYKNKKNYVRGINKEIPCIVDGRLRMNAVRFRFRGRRNICRPEGRWTDQRRDFVNKIERLEI
jgi:hypothetical protein